MNIYIYFFFAVKKHLTSTVAKYYTSSWRLCPSKLKGFKKIATVNAFLNLLVLRISIAVI